MLRDLFIRQFIAYLSWIGKWIWDRGVVPKLPKVKVRRCSYNAIIRCWPSQYIRQDIQYLLLKDGSSEWEGHNKLRYSPWEVWGESRDTKNFSGPSWEKETVWKEKNRSNMLIVIGSMPSMSKLLKWRVPLSSPLTAKLKRYNDVLKELSERENS